MYIFCITRLTGHRTHFQFELLIVDILSIFLVNFEKSKYFTLPGRKIYGLIGSAVLTLICYKQVDKQSIYKRCSLEEV